jgi:tripartite-type tricarboxylate transporter receptor subunit TctC
MRTNGQKNKHKMVFLCLTIAIGFGLVIGSTLIHGQEKGFPSKPVEMVVPYAPGGSIDIGARIFVEPLSRELKVPVVVRNQAGGGGLTGTTAFFNTKPDGYTILATSPGGIIPTVQLSKNPSFDPRKDFLPLGHIGVSPVAMSVPRDSPFKSFDDFLQFAKKNPGKLRGGYSSPGGETHVMFMSIIKDTKIETKMVPYTSSGELAAALLGGHLDWKCSTLVSTMGYVRSGDMRPLLLTQRSPEVPGVPSGPDIGLPSVSVNIWLGFFVHSKIPKAAYDRLVSAVKAAFNDVKMRDLLTKAGYIVEYKDPQELTKLINRDWEAFAEVLEATGMKGK